MFGTRAALWRPSRTKTPDSCLSGVFLNRNRSWKKRSEVTLSAEVDRNRTHVAVLPTRSTTRNRERRAGRTGGNTRHVGLQVGIQDFRAEGQVLDRSPAGRETDLGHREAWVAGIASSRNRSGGFAANRIKAEAGY